MLAPRPACGNGYSATVRLRLLIAGQQFPVAQIGGELLVFDTPTALPGPDGEIVMTVDGQERRWRVALQVNGEPVRMVKAHFSEVS